MKLPILVTSLINKKEQENFTKDCIASLWSEDHILDVRLDSRNCPGKLTQKWNEFCDEYRGKDYEYIIIIANDTIARPESIDYMVRFMEDNPEVGIGESKLNRSKQDFLLTHIAYTDDYDKEVNDTSNFIIRKGVIEKVGRFNEIRYPFSKNEHDYLYRCELAGIIVAQTRMQMFYHPIESLTPENRGDFKQYVDAYIMQWGGDWNSPRFEYPFNNPELDYTFSEY